MHTKTKITFIACLSILIFAPSSTVACFYLAECSPFYCSFESNGAVLDCNGVIDSELSFVPAVNCNGAYFDGNDYVRFSGDMFNSSSGSISLWFKKNSADNAGGIVQIGHLGTANSIGIFYAYSDDIFFEIRNNNSDYKTINSPNAISETKGTHIVAIWDRREDESNPPIVTYHIKLFINGRYAGGQALTGPFIHNQGFMDIGVAGTKLGMGKVKVS